MKNIIDNLAEAVTLINQISEYDYEGMRTIICMLIDVASAQYHIQADKILGDICSVVKSVNEELGPYSNIK